MPDLSSSASALRADGYQYRLYLSTPAETEVWRGSVTGTITEPALQLSVTTDSGTAGDVEADMEAEVFDSGGTTSKGRVRVAAGALSGGIIQIEEVSAGRIQIVATDKIAVYQSFRLRGKLVASSSDFEKDSRTAYTNQNEVVRPVAIAGGAWCGFVDDGGSTVDVAFDASNSYTVDSDSGGSKTYLWNFDGGTIQSGSTTSATATVRFSAGTYWVKLTVTDSSNSAAQTIYTPVIVHARTGATAPLELTVCTLQGALATGWEATFSFADDASRTTLPNGALVVIWAEEWHNGTKVSYGSNVSGRSHIKFVGYLIEDTPGVDANADGEGQRELPMRALSPVAMLAQLPGFSQVLEIATTPASWQEYKDLKVKAALIYLLRWHTTLLTTHDLLLNVTDYDYPAFYITESAPNAQVQEIADATDAYVTGNRNGQVHIYTDPMSLGTTDRAALTTTFTLTADDIFAVRMRNTHRFTYSQIEGRGFTAATSVGASRPLLSVAPGTAPAEAPQRTVIERLIVTSQDDLNTRTGHRYARENWLYDGLLQPVDIELELLPSLDIFDFRREWIKLTLASSYNPRGLSFSASRLHMDRCTITYNADDGSKTVLLTCQPETRGVAATTDVVEDGEGTIYEFPELPPLEVDLPGIFDPVVIDPLPTSTTIPQGDPGYLFAAAATQAKVGYCTFDWTTGASSWTTITSGLSGNCQWALADPYNYRRYFVLTTAGLYKCDNVFAASPSFSLVANNSTIFGSSSSRGVYMEMSINRRGWLMISGGGDSTNQCFSVAYTTDYGATWNTRHVGSGTASFPTAATYRDGVRFGTSLWNNPNKSDEGYVYAAYRSTDGFSEYYSLRRSKDWGDTWEIVGGDVAVAFGVVYPPHVMFPYKRRTGTSNLNGDDQEAWCAANGGSDSGHHAKRNGAGTDMLSVAYSAFNPYIGISGRKRPIYTYPDDGNVVYCLIGTGGSTTVMRSSRGWSDFDDGSDYTTSYQVGDNDGTYYWTGGMNGWGNDPNKVLHWGSGIDTIGNTGTFASTDTIYDAYNGIATEDIGGFIRMTRNANLLSSATWTYIIPPFTDQQVAYAEFMLGVP